MAWDATKPTTGTKLRLVPSVITPNWDAIETGEVPYDKLQLQEQAGNPTNTADTAYLYSKEDSATGYTELFSINSNGNAIQLTKGAVEQVTPTASTLSSAGRVYLPGGAIMAWGSATATGGANTAFTYGFTFGTIYNVQITPQQASAVLNDVDLYITGTPNTTGFTVRNSTGANFLVYWFAIGKS